MKKSILIMPFMLLQLLACAEKNVHSSESQTDASKADAATAAKPAFFMSKPQPTSPLEVTFDEKLEGHKALNYRKNDCLHMSGSANFSANALKEIAKPAKKSKLMLYVFDLGQESHGYINDKLVTWESPNDWGLADLNHGEAVQRERRLLMDTSMGSKVAGKTVSSTETEESVVRSRGYEYVRLTVTDSLRPSDSETDLFIEAVRALPEKNWVHFHDRNGKDRTAMFMLMYDMLRNAKTESLEVIAKRNVDLSKEDILAIPAQDNAKYIYQKERAEFVREFYNYAKAHPNGESVLWTEWVRK